MDLVEEAQNGNILNVDFLIDRGISVNAYNDEGYTALMLASLYSNTSSNLETVELLLDRGAFTKVEPSPLSLAAVHSNTTSNLETVELLLDRGADVNEIIGEDNMTILMMVSENSNTTSNLETVELLLDRGADVNAKNYDKKTALMYASKNSNSTSTLETVELLLDRGANVNAKDDEGYSALMLASEFSNIETVKLLLDRGAEINPALAVANIKTFNFLLDRGADVNARTNDGWTALMTASVKGTNSNITELLNRGAEINAKGGEENLSVLMYAAQYSDNVETVKLLLERGADPFEECPTEKCNELLAEYRWKQLYKKDKDMAIRYNKEIPITKDVWEIILLNKRQQQLCENLSSDKNKNILKLFAMELNIPINENMTKAHLCGIISKYLAYGRKVAKEPNNLEK